MGLFLKMKNFKNNYSHLTAKKRKYLSMPTRKLLELGLLNGDILDFGCGFGKDVDLLKMKGFNVLGYDSHYFPKSPNKKFDTVICNYVLNILTQEEQSYVLMEISELLKPNGKAYFSVRRDIKTNRIIYNPKHGVKTYQANVKLLYSSIFLNENSEIYEYQHYTLLNIGRYDVSPFLKDNSQRELVTESATFFSIYDGFPVNPGHVLIIPKRIVSNYFELNNHEIMAANLMIKRVKKILDSKYKPDGYNIGVNINKAGGQTINHVHIHIIPRYFGDIDNPTGGIRGVIPSKRIY